MHKSKEQINTYALLTNPVPPVTNTLILRVGSVFLKVKLKLIEYEPMENKQSIITTRTQHNSWSRQRKRPLLRCTSQALHGGKKPVLD